MIGAVGAGLLARRLLARVPWTRLRGGPWQYAAVVLFVVLLFATAAPRGYTVKKLLSPLLPCLLLGFAWLWPWRADRKRRVAALAGACALTSVAVVAWIPKPDWRAASAYLIDHARADGVVLLEPGYMTVPFDYYNGGRTRRAGVPVAAAPDDLRKSVRGSSEVWFAFDPRDCDGESRNLRWLTAHAAPFGRTDFYRLRLYRFELPHQAQAISYPGRPTSYIADK